MTDNSSRIMALDYGRKRIGVAVSDVTHTLARGIAVIERTTPEQDCAKLKALFETHTIGVLVIGITKKDDGTLSNVGQEAVAFGKILASFFSGSIVLYDETMTTRDAAAVCMQLGKRTKQFKKQIDKYAAEVLLSEYLNTMQNA